MRIFRNLIRKQTITRLSIKEQLNSPLITFRFERSKCRIRTCFQRRSFLGNRHHLSPSRCIIKQAFHNRLCRPRVLSFNNTISSAFLSRCQKGNDKSTTFVLNWVITGIQGALSLNPWDRIIICYEAIVYTFGVGIYFSVCNDSAGFLK